MPVKPLLSLGLIADVTKPNDATKIKDGDLAARLAARRQWEGVSDSASAAEPAPATRAPRVYSAEYTRGALVVHEHNSLVYFSQLDLV
jgi:hypothetical protein